MNNKKCIECGGLVTTGWGLIRDRPWWKIFTADEEWSIQCQAKIERLNEKCYGCTAYGKNGIYLNRNGWNILRSKW